MHPDWNSTTKVTMDPNGPPRPMIVTASMAAHAAFEAFIGREKDELEHVIARTKDPKHTRWSVSVDLLTSQRGPKDTYVAAELDTSTGVCTLEGWMMLDDWQKYISFQYSNGNWCIDPVLQPMSTYPY